MKSGATLLILFTASPIISILRTAFSIGFVIAVWHHRAKHKARQLAAARILNLLVVLECFKVRQGLKVAAGALDGLGNVPEVVFDAFGMPHRGRACCKTLLRNFGGNAFGVSTDTGTPRSFSASIFKAASVSRLVDSAGSTSKSRSLSSVSVPFKTDPKTRGRAKPWRLTRCRNSVRCAARASDGFIATL